MSILRKQKLVSLFVTVFFAGSILFVALPAYAADTNTSGGGLFNNLVSFFSSKFGLEKSKVQSAMEEFKDTKKQEMGDRLENHVDNRLDALVKNEKITEAQKQAILTEMAALQSKYNAESFKNLTTVQRKARLQEEKNEIDAWAKSQNIDPKYIFPGFFNMGMMGKMRKFDKWGGNMAKPSGTTQQ